MSWPKAKPVQPSEPDHYYSLGLRQNATTRDVRLAYMRLAKVHHPDKQGSAQQVDAVEFRTANQAYEVLKDPVARTNYDYSYPDVLESWCQYDEDLKQWEKEDRLKSQQREAEEVSSRLRAHERKKEQEAARKRADIVDRQQRRHRQEEQSAREEEEEKARHAQQQNQKARQQRVQEEAEEMERKLQEATRQKWRESRERERQQRLKAQEQQAAAASERFHRDCEREAADAELRKKNATGNHTTQENEQRFAEENYLRQEEAFKLQREQRQRKADQRSKLVIQEAQARQRSIAEQKLRQQESRPWPAPPDNKRPYPDTPSSTPDSRPSKIFKPSTDNRSLRNSMARIHARERHMQELLDLGGAGYEPKLMGVYIELGWARMDAEGKCDFCKRNIQLEMFVCPSGGSKACTPCKMKFSFYSSC